MARLVFGLFSPARTAITVTTGTRVTTQPLSVTRDDQNRQPCDCAAATTMNTTRVPMITPASQRSALATRRWCRRRAAIDLSRRRSMSEVASAASGSKSSRTFSRSGSLDGRKNAIPPISRMANSRRVTATAASWNQIG